MADRTLDEIIPALKHFANEAFRHGAVNFCAVLPEGGYISTSVTPDELLSVIESIE